MGWSELDEVYLTLSQESADSVEEAEACRSDSDTEWVDVRPVLPTLPTVSSAASSQADADCGASCASSDVPSITTAGGYRKPALCNVWWKESVVAAAHHLKCKQSLEPVTPLKLVSTCSGLLAEAAALQEAAMASLVSLGPSDLVIVLGVPAEFLSAADLNGDCQKIILANYQSDVCHLHPGMAEQISGSACMLHRDATCGCSCQGAEFAVSGTPCPPYSDQRHKRFHDGSVKAHPQDKITAELLVTWLVTLNPQAGLQENVTGWNKLDTSTHQRETTTAMTRFLESVQDATAESGQPGYHFIVVEMDHKWRAGKTGSHVLRRESRRVLEEMAEDAEHVDPTAADAQAATNLDADIDVGRPVALELAVQQSSVGNPMPQHLVGVLAPGSSASLQVSLLQLASEELSIAQQHAGADESRSEKRADESEEGDADISASALQDFIARVLDSGPRPQTALVADAEALGIATRSFSRNLIALASATHLCSSASWSLHCRMLKERIDDGTLKVRLLLRHRVYDETPVRLRVPPAMNDSRGLRAADSCLAKVLQTKFRIALLLEDVASGQFACHHAPLHVPLQALESTTGEDLATSQIAMHRHLEEVESLGAHCDLRVNIATADRYSGNLRAEELLHTLLPHDIPTRFPCQVHDTSRAMTWQTAPVSETVTGMISTALVLGSAGTLSKFRQILAEEIEARLQIHVGDIPGGEIEDYRLAVYNLYLSLNLAKSSDKRLNRRKRLVQRKVLNYFLAMDIQDETQVTLCTHGHLVDPAQAMWLVRRFIVPALVPEGLRLFARHRWHGGELSIDWCGLLQAHHGLLKPVLLRLLGPVSMISPIADPSSGLALADDSDVHEGWQTLAVDMLSRHGQRETMEAAQAADAVAGSSAAALSNDAEQRLADFNTAAKAKVRAWISSADLNVFAILRTALNPVVDLVFLYLHISSDKWRNHQEWSLCQGKERSYKLTEVFFGHGFTEAKHRVEKVFHSGVPALAQAGLTQANKNLLFRHLAVWVGGLSLLGRLICALEHNLGAIRQQLKPCQVDILSQWFLDTFPSASKLQSDLCRAMVHSIAACVSVDVAEVECRHAQVRKLLTAKGQTWDTLLETLSADLLVRQVAKAQADDAEVLDRLAFYKTHPAPDEDAFCEFKQQREMRVQAHKKHARAAKAKQRANALKKKQRKRILKQPPQGGAQRAFMHQELPKASRQDWKNRGALFKRVNAAFHRLTAAEKQRFSELGQAGTDSARAGSKAFVAAEPRPAKRARKQIDDSSNVFVEGSHLAVQHVHSEDTDWGRICTKASDMRKHAVEDAAGIARRNEDTEAWQQGHVAAFVAQDLEANEHSALKADQFGAVVPFAPCRYIPEADTFPTGRWLNPAAELAKASLIRNADLHGRPHKAIMRLQDDWSCRHKLVPSQKGSRMLATPFNRSSCLQHGMCICAGVGQLAHMCHSNLVDAVRPFLRLVPDKAVRTAPESAGAGPAVKGKKKKSKARLMMEQSELFLELRPKPKHQAASSGEGLAGWSALEAQFAAAATASSTSWDEYTDESLWFFVGYANFKVYDFTFLVLECLDVECNSDEVLNKAFLHVPDESLHVSRSRMALADLVDFHRQWRAVWWQLDNRHKQLNKDDFVPDVLEVIPLNPELLPVFTIWQGKAEEELRRKRAPSRNSGGGGHGPGGPPGGPGGRKPQALTVDTIYLEST
ncbi:unnamed protein product [Symbiodinium sp. CCMP2592]|nr:unnamed protein product [Symbiodinium sp. CCMP2592]